MCKRRHHPLDNLDNHAPAQRGPAPLLQAPLWAPASKSWARETAFSAFNLEWFASSSKVPGKVLGNLRGFCGHWRHSVKIHFPHDETAPPSWPTRPLDAEPEYAEAFCHITGRGKFLKSWYRMAWPNMWNCHIHFHRHDYKIHQWLPITVWYNTLGINMLWWAALEGVLPLLVACSKWRFCPRLQQKAKQSTHDWWLRILSLGNG